MGIPIERVGLASDPFSASEKKALLGTSQSWVETVFHVCP